MIKMSSPLYQDAQLEIGYMKNSEDYFLKISGYEKSQYYIPLGVFEDLAMAPRGELERIITPFNDLILLSCKKNYISTDELHIVLSQAYVEEQKRFNKFRREEEI
jgi:hypothetical protein